MRLPDDARAVTEAREVARRWANARRVPAGARAAVELAVDELVTNAVIHGEPPIDLTITKVDHAIRGEVTDHSLVPPTVKSADEYGGFGLRIVDASTNRWGYVAVPDGKTVWFEIDLDR